MEADVVLTIVRASAPLPPFEREVFRPELRGMSFRDIADVYGLEEWDETLVAHRGRWIRGDELDSLPVPGSIVTVMPAPGAGVGEFLLVSVIIPLLVSAAVGYIANRLTRPGSPQDRGDEESPTYAYNGIGTNYGAGFFIPIVGGKHQIGGQVVNAGVFSMGPRTEGLRTHLVLSEGPVYSIGGVTQDSDNLGTLDGGIYAGAFPSDVRVNGTLLRENQARASVRLGRRYQAPMPEFDGTETTIAVNESVDEPPQLVSVAIGSDEARRVRLRVLFTGGLYQVDAAGSYSPITANFRYRWRETGPGTSGAWQPHIPFSVSPAVAERGPFVHEQEFELLAFPNATGYEVEVERLGDTNAVPNPQFVQSSANLKDLVHATPGRFGYSNKAGLALTLRANDGTTGNVQFSAPVEGVLVRVWDSEHGWSGTRDDESAKLYKNPTSGSFSGIWSYDVGRNPAWFAIELLTARWGLGRFVDDAHIDVAAFRNWADFCDQDDGSGGPLFRFDGVFDQGEEAAQALARVFQAGRAIPVLRGNQISVVYQYNGAHGRGSNSVPAKSIVDIVATSNCEEFEARYLDTSNRPNVLDAQFLNENKRYQQDVVSQPDPNTVGANDPFSVVPLVRRAETVSLYGITRPSQIRRELLFIHNVNRLSKREFRWKAGIAQMALEVGDLVGIQHDAYRPWPYEEWHGFRASRDVTTTAEIYLDRDLPVPNGAGSITLDLIQADGTWTNPVITEAAPADGVYPKDTALALNVSISIKAGEPVAIGFRDTATTDTYGVETAIITSVRELPDEKREFEALLWSEDWFDTPVDFAEDVAATEAGTAEVATTVVGVPATATAVEDPDTTVQIQRGAAPDEYVVTWDQPQTKVGKRARVYARRDTGPPQLLGESSTGMLKVAGLDPRQAVELFVVVEEEGGVFAAPTSATAVSRTPPEFRITDYFSVARVTATSIEQDPDVVVLSWPEVSGGDLLYYEVRRGSAWNGAEILYRGSKPRAVLGAPLVGNIDFMVRARFAGGLYSAAAAEATLTISDTSTNLLEDDLSGTLAGTLSAGLQQDSGNGWIEFAAGAYSGTYTVELDPASGDVDREWRVEVDRWVEDLAQLADVADFGLDSSEAIWRTVAGREPSLGSTGADFDVTVNDALELVGDSVDPIGPDTGSVGDHVRVQLDVRFDLTATGWTDWQPYEPQRRTAKRMELRITAERWSPDHDVRLDRITLEAFD